MKQTPVGDRHSSRQETPNAMSRFDIGDEKTFYKGMSDLEGPATHFIKRSYVEDLTKLPRMQEVPGHSFQTSKE
jgi:hypothetical protein